MTAKDLGLEKRQKKRIQRRDLHSISIVNWQKHYDTPRIVLVEYPECLRCSNKPDSTLVQLQAMLVISGLKIEMLNQVEATDTKRTK